MTKLNDPDFANANDVMSVYGPDPMFGELKRVRTERGSHIEPELDPLWDQLTKLRWLAATVRVDSGIRVVVNPADAWANGVKKPDMYQLNFVGRAIAALSYAEAWHTLTGINIGVNLYQEMNRGKLKETIDDNWHFPDTSDQRTRAEIEHPIGPRRPK